MGRQPLVKGGHGWGEGQGFLGRRRLCPPRRLCVAGFFGAKLWWGARGGLCLARLLLWLRAGEGGGTVWGALPSGGIRSREPPLRLAPRHLFFPAIVGAAESESGRERERARCAGSVLGRSSSGGHGAWPGGGAEKVSSQRVLARLALPPTEKALVLPVFLWLILCVGQKGLWHPGDFLTGAPLCSG